MVAADEKTGAQAVRHAQCVRFDDALAHPLLLEGHVGQFKDRTPEIELREPGTSRPRRSSKACRPEVPRGSMQFHATRSSWHLPRGDAVPFPQVEPEAGRGLRDVAA